MGRVQHAELAHHVGLAEQGFQHQVRALVGRAQHDQAGTVARHQFVPQRGVLVDQCTHHQTAHAVRQHAHRLQRAAGSRSGRVELRPQHLGQPVCQHVHRQPPVVGVCDHAVAARQVFVQVAVRLGEQRLGLDFVLRRVGLELKSGQPATGQRSHAEPHAVAPVQPQVRAHQAGQQNRHRSGRNAAAAGLARRGAGQGALVDTAQRTEGLDLFHRGLEQPAARGQARGVVDEVAEVAHVRPLVEHHPGVVGPGDAGAHRVGVHHQVVVGVVEEREIGEQHTEPLEQAAAFDVARNHGQPDAALRRGPRQQARHRRARQQRLDAGHQVGFGSVARDFEHHPFEGRIDRVALQRRHPPHQRQQARQEDIEVAAGQPRATRRRGHAHIAFQPQLLAPQFGGQLAQRLALLGVRGQQFARDARALGRVGLAQRGGVQRVAVDQLVEVFQAQQVAHQTAARMRQQVNRRPFGQGARELQCVVDRALGQSAVFERQHPVGVAVFKRFPETGGGVLQLIEAGLRAGPGAVNHHQQRPGLGVGLQLRVSRQQQFSQFAVHPAVQPGVALEAAFQRPHQRLGADPAHAQIGVLRDLVFGLLADPLAGLAPGGVDDRVGCLAHGQRVDARYQRAQAAGHRVAQDTAHCHATRAQRVLENESARGVHSRWVDALQRVVQVGRVGDERHAFGQLQHHHLAFIRRQRVLGVAARG